MSFNYFRKYNGREKKPKDSLFATLCEKHYFVKEQGAPLITSCISASFAPRGFFQGTPVFPSP